MGDRFFSATWGIIWFSVSLFLFSCDHFPAEDFNHDGKLVIRANFNHGPLSSEQIRVLSHVPVQFIHQSHGFDEYEWEFPDGEKSKELAVQKVFEKRGEFWVKLHGRGPINVVDSILVFVQIRELTVLRFTFPPLHPIFQMINRDKFVFRILESTPENNIPELDTFGRYDTNVLYETKPSGGVGDSFANLVFHDFPRPILEYPDPGKNLGYIISYELGNGKEEILISNWLESATVFFEDNLFNGTSVFEITHGEISLRMEAIFDY